MAVKKEYKQLALYLLLLSFGILLLGAISLSGSGFTLLDFFRALSVQFGFLVISILAYSTTLLTGKILGLGKDKIFHVWTGILIGIFYIFASSLIPGLSIATPLLPGAISGALQGFIIRIVAPIVESVFFLGVVLAVFLNLGWGKWKSIIAQAVLFASFHLGAYLIGLYDYSATQGFLGLASNISVFISAFIFAMLTGYLVSLKRYSGILVAIIIHAVINNWVATTFAIIFAFAISLI